MQALRELIDISIEVSHDLEVLAAEFAKVPTGRAGRIATAC
jgi:hypothetical protein